MVWTQLITVRHSYPCAAAWPNEFRRSRASSMTRLEGECFVYNWRILLAGAASAGILTVGIAAPALGQPVSRTDIRPASSLTGATQGTGGPAVADALCDLPSLPMAGPVDSAVAGMLGAPCGSSGTTGGTSSGPIAAGSPPVARNAANAARGTARDAANAARGAARGATKAARGATSMLPGLSSVSGAIPGLSSLSSVVPGLSSVISRLPGFGPLISNLPGASPAAGALPGLRGGSGGA
jgi:hypothetical protein